MHLYLALSDPEVWNKTNIRPDGTVLIVHSNKDLTSGQEKKASFTWVYGVIVVCMTEVCWYKS